MVYKGMNPPSSQVAGHLNKVPIEIQSLSLLIGVGSDRQPEPRCLLWFHILVFSGATMKATAQSLCSTSKYSQSSTQLVSHVFPGHHGSADQEQERQLLCFPGVITRSLDLGQNKCLFQNDQ